VVGRGGGVCAGRERARWAGVGRAARRVHKGSNGSGVCGNVCGQCVVWQQMAMCVAVAKRRAGGGNGAQACAS